MILLFVVLVAALVGLGFLNAWWWVVAAVLIYAIVHHGHRRSGGRIRGGAVDYQDYRDRRDREERWDRRYRRQRKGFWWSRDRRDEQHHE
ncbi:hypothetical protein [Streptomyces sp. NPDC002564]|uniref:hypothetical protein n=1 Tax=Streptomyces sp. NPDC002564 TaxID=3364649 RepID=UPI0036CFD509